MQAFPLTIFGQKLMRETLIENQIESIGLEFSPAHPEFSLPV